MSGSIQPLGPLLGGRQAFALAFNDHGGDQYENDAFVNR